MSGANRNIERLRRDYSGEELAESNVSPDPFKQFLTWFDEAVNAEISDPHAMVLATASADGRPSARVVLLRGIDDDGLTFYTNYGSRKSLELEANPRAALVFPWHELDRQVRVEGNVSRREDRASDEYFASRPRASQISAWASNQSGFLRSRSELEERFRKFEREFAGRDVPRPENWGGFRLSPESFEFWQGRPSRMHDRILYALLPGGEWKIERLAP